MINSSSPWKTISIKFYKQRKWFFLLSPIFPCSPIDVRYLVVTPTVLGWLCRNSFVKVITSSGIWGLSLGLSKVNVKDVINVNQWRSSNKASMLLGCSTRKTELNYHHKSQDFQSLPYFQSIWNCCLASYDIRSLNLQ